MSNYKLHSKVPIAGMYDGDNPIVELGVIDVVPKGTVIISDKPRCDKKYTRQARTGLSPDEAREVANALNRMADKMEEKS
jgi:hypothetical protein